MERHRFVFHRQFPRTLSGWRFPLIQFAQILFQCIARLYKQFLRAAEFQLIGRYNAVNGDVYSKFASISGV